MKIITQRQSDSIHLKAFVAKTFSEHKDLERNFISCIDNKMNKGIYSIDNEDGLVVLATTFQSTWHPYCIYVRLAYDFSRVNVDALQSMIDGLKEQFDKPLFFLIDNRFESLDEVLLSRGFRSIRKTDVISIKSQQSEMVTIERKGIAISEIITNPILMTSLFELCRRIYSETHLDNPVGDIVLSSWESVIMEDLNAKYSYVVINENKVIAYSLIYEVDEQNWELGWIGVENPSEMNLLDGIITLQIQDASKLGIITIEKEVDSTCPYSLHIAASLTFDVSETLYAFISK